MAARTKQSDSELPLTRIGASPPTRKQDPAPVAVFRETPAVNSIESTGLDLAPIDTGALGVTPNRRGLLDAALMGLLGPTAIGVEPTPQDAARNRSKRKEAGAMAAAGANAGSDVADQYMQAQSGGGGDDLVTAIQKIAALFTAGK